MTNFVYDGTSLPSGKSDARPLTGAAAQNVTAAEWNTVMQALADLRSAVTGGQYHGLVDNEAAIGAAGSARLRYFDGLLQASLEGGDYQSLFLPTVRTVSDFGAVGDGVTDDLAAFDAAIAACVAGDILFVPQGTYALSGTLHITKTLTLRGSGPQWYGVVTTTLLFPASTDGIVVDATAPGAVVQNLTIGASSKSAAAYGVQFKARASLLGCYVGSFKTHNFYIDGTSPVNCNNFFVARCAFDNADDDGFRVTGADANAGMVLQCSSRVNDGYGFHDTSLLSSLYMQCHTEDNVGGSYSFHNSGQGGMLLNCYAEGGQTFDVVYPAIVVGGTLPDRANNTNLPAGKGDPITGLVLGGGGTSGGGALVDVGVLGPAAGGAEMAPNISLFYPAISSDTVNTATPMHTGLTVGQRFSYYNNTIHTFTIQDNATLAGSKMYLKSPVLQLLNGESVEFWAYATDTAIEIRRSLNLAPVDSSGTPGNATQHSRTGRVAFAAAGSAVTVTNKLIRPGSIIGYALETADATLTSVTIVPASGSFTVTGNAAATGITVLSWWLVSE